MKTKKAELDEVLAGMQAVIDKATEENRDITDDEAKSLEEMNEKANEIKATIERQERGAALLASVGAMKSEIEPTEEGKRKWRPGSSTVDSKGFLGLSGVAGKKAARQIAEAVAGRTGTKGLLEPGVVATEVPLLSASPLELAKLPTSILDVLPVVKHATPSWRYLVQTVRENNARIVAPGEEKPESKVTTTSKDGHLEVFAHLSEPLDKYLLADNDTLASFVQGEMLYMLLDAIEEDVLNGDGSTGHLRGILNTSGLQTQAFDGNAVDTLRYAALKLESSGYETSVYVISAADWAAIETYRDGEGRNYLGGPIDRAEKKLWGTQVVTSTRLAAGTALALDIDAVHLDTDNFGIETALSREIGFKSNELLMRTEGRFGVSVTRPSAIVKATIAGD